MKNGLSGSIVNEMEVNNHWEEQRKNALELLTKLKKLEKEKPKKLIRVNKQTITTEEYFIVMTKIQIL